MNRNEIMTMTADELRLAIALAKGWKLYRFDYFGETDTQGIFAPDYKPSKYKTQIDFSEFLPRKYINPDGMPDWTTSIADAWELMEEMSALDYPIPGICRMDENDNWNCYYRFAGDQGIEIVEADTAPLAISRAWLLWKTEAE